MKSDQFASLSKEYRATWVCPACTNVTRRTRTNADTPVRHTQVPLTDESMNMSCDNLDKSQSATCLPVAHESITIDKFNELLNTLNVWRNDMNVNMLAIRDDIKGTLCEIQTEMKYLRNEQATLKQSVSNINAEIKGLKDSVQFQAEDHSNIKKRVEDLARIACEQTATAYSGLESKIDTLEQQARQCNIEICNLPERRNENLVGIMEAIGSVTRFQFSPQKDIISVHRVPHAQQGCDRPKNIIVKFATRTQRDNLLASYHKVKSLKSDQLGITGTSSLIYMNEHLTLKRKQLFRKCREVAKELRYKYVWIKNSTILVRERDDSPAFAIRNESDLAKLKPSSKN